MKKTTMAEPSGNPYPGKGTDGVKTLLGDPRKAIIKLAIPMVVAMSVQTIYNIVDAFWVAGLGADALAAMGFVFPFFFVIMSLSNGLGIGGGAAISRRIGAKDKAGCRQRGDPYDHYDGAACSWFFGAVLSSCKGYFCPGGGFRNN